MITLTLPASLLRLARHGDDRAHAAINWASLEPGPWDHFVEQLQQQFPDLASRVLTDSGDLARGFALVVNGCPARDCRSLRVGGDDALAFIPYIAGG